jgi:hypothetical protein
MSCTTLCPASLSICVRECKVACWNVRNSLPDGNCRHARWVCSDAIGVNGFTGGLLWMAGT